MQTVQNDNVNVEIKQNLHDQAIVDYLDTSEKIQEAEKIYSARDFQEIGIKEINQVQKKLNKKENKKEKEKPAN